MSCPRGKDGVRASLFEYSLPEGNFKECKEWGFVNNRVLNNDHSVCLGAALCMISVEITPFGHLCIVLVSR